MFLGKPNAFAFITVQSGGALSMCFSWLLLHRSDQECSQLCWNINESRVLTVPMMVQSLSPCNFPHSHCLRLLNSLTSSIFLLTCSRFNRFPKTMRQKQDNIWNRNLGHRKGSIDTFPIFCTLYLPKAQSEERCRHEK